MAYTPKTWACGDTITAEELNRMEEGISSAQSAGGGTALLVKATLDDSGLESKYVLDHTWQEIADADIAYLVSNENSPVFSKTVIASIEGGKGFYSVSTSDARYQTDAASGYPSRSYGGGGIS